jgi:hypothetical protein
LVRERAAWRKKPAPEQEYQKVCDKLHQSWDRWGRLKTEGGSDPFWPDGYNMNLVRNHVFHERRQILISSSEYGYDLPLLYYDEPPLEVPNNFMARPDEIRDAARISLQVYLSDTNYLYMLKHRHKVDTKSADRMCLGNIFNYTEGLRSLIEKDDLVSMRRHGKPDGYLDSFKHGADKIRKYLEKQEAIGG